MAARGPAGHGGRAQVHRPPWAPVAAAATLLASIVLAVDVLRRGTATQVVTALLVLAALDLLAYVFGLRPRLVELPDGVEVVNPLRQVRLRWSDVEDVLARDVLVLETASGPVRCASVPSTGGLTERTRLAGRAHLRAPEDPPGAEAPAEGSLGASGVAARLVTRWEAAGGAGVAPDGVPPRLTWHRPAVVMVVLAAVLLVLAGLVALA